MGPTAPQGAWDAETLRCHTCGSVLCPECDDSSVADSDEMPIRMRDAVERKPKAAKPHKDRKRRVTPEMMANSEYVCAAVRIACLSAIPGVGPRRAAAILRRYHTIPAIVDAGPEHLSTVCISSNAQLGERVANAVVTALS